MVATRASIAARPAWAVAAVALVVLALLAAAWVALQRDAVAADTATAASAPAISAPAFVKSQEGTQPDGNLARTPTGTAADENTPLPYGELRRLFDYYLSAVGEQNLPAITQQIQTELDQRLKPAQSKKARRLLDLYLSFRHALVDLEAKPALAGTAVSAIRQRMLAQQDLRTQYFSAAEIDGMFGFEDLMDADAVARLEITQNAKLSAAQKQQQLAAMDAAMSPALRAEREASQVVLRVEQRATDMRAKGASDDEIYRMRAKEFDAGAASRLADLDREEAAWAQRIATYLEARSAVLKSQANATATERQQAIAQLQQSMFNEDERRRLAAYEPG
jgi:lipase chaperone LimK